MAGLRVLEPDAASVLLYNALADRQSDAAARVLVPGMQFSSRPTFFSGIALENVPKPATFKIHPSS